MKEVTDSQIKKWKKEYGTVIKYEVDDKVCFCKKPSLQAFSLLAKFADGNLEKGINILIEDVWIDGDLAFKTDPEYQLSLSEAIQSSFKKKQIKSQTL